MCGLHASIVRCVLPPIFAGYYNGLKRQPTCFSCDQVRGGYRHTHAHAHTSVVRAAFRGAAQCSYGLRFSPHRSSQVKLRLDCVSTRQVPAQVRRDALRDLPAELVPDGRAPATFHIEGALHVTNASLLPGPARCRLPLQFAQTEWHAAARIATARPGAKKPFGRQTPRRATTASRVRPAEAVRAERACLTHSRTTGRPSTTSRARPRMPPCTT